MSGRQVEGAALLVAGHGAPGVGAFDASAVHTLGQIGEALLATGSRWHVRRLTASTGDRYAADRKTIKRSLTELVSDPVRIAVLVLLGEFVEVGGELSLVTGSEAYEYPEDATLPLSFIRERLANAQAQHLVMAISACGSGTPDRWLAALGTSRSHHVVAVDAPVNGHPMIDALLGGLCGDALDPQTGTVTMASLSKHLKASAKALQGSAIDETVAQPPPLGGLWDVRRSQLANRPRPALPGEAEDLTGLVLPGRFRLDHKIAKGTFGTVYRARQLAVERDIAVKLLNGDIDPSSEDGKLFVHEIRAVGRIDNPNVVRILQADITHDGRLFYAMELLDGADLQKLGADKLPKDRAIDLTRQLLAGLAAAHDAGLVHADIKPANAIVVQPRSPDPAIASDASTKAERLVLVDFGLARLRSPDRPAESAGGTPAYMAPEQLNTGRVDARSDLFSVGLVLNWMITGWRRKNAAEIIPPKDLIDDPRLREILARALDLDPAKRYQTAREFAAALGAPAVEARASQPIPTAPPPFRQFASLTKDDRERIQGREADIALITEHALYRRAVVYAAPSGTGKTSLLQAGLIPRLESLGIHAAYVRCRSDFAWSVVKAISPGASSIADAITTFHTKRGGKLVLVIDQLETALGDPEFISNLLGFDRWPGSADISVVLSCREDYLARLLDRTREIDPTIPIVRLPPLTPAGAREAIRVPLAESRLKIEPELLDLLLVDLERAAAAIGPEMGWGDTPAVFPPHLQLVCSVLHEKAVAAQEDTLTVALYRQLGGFDAIVGEHLDREIDALDDGRDLIARDIFLLLVTGSNQRAIRPESEVESIVGARHGKERTQAVLSFLEQRGLLLHTRGNQEWSWELMHDSLVARVQSWIDRKDLARRRAIEVVRYHLRRSSKEAPSLLTRKELRELARHRGAVEELEAEWQKRELPDVGWTPSSLVARSRTVLRRTIGLLVSVVVLALSVGGWGLYRSQVEEARARAEASLRARDLGRFTLSLEPFDWDPSTLTATPVAPSPGDYSWVLHAPMPDQSAPGAPFDESWVVHGTPRLIGNAIIEDVEAHGGPGLLVIERHGCTPSIVPLRQLPGVAVREHASPTFHVRVPTCQASVAGTVRIPDGPFLFSGLGDPPAAIHRKYPAYALERRITLPAFSIDRTEVTNAQWNVFGAMEPITGIDHLPYTTSSNLGATNHPQVPVTGIDWSEAGAFCAFFGKRLPTTEQWTKALRGGEQLSDGPNPNPRRNLPWGTAEAPAWIGSNVVSAVGAHSVDVSPYGVLDLAANVTEWTATKGSDPGVQVVRGANWSEVMTVEDLINFVALDNPRAGRNRLYSLGVRCVTAN